MQEEVTMLELTIYGLIGLSAMLVVAFCFAYADEYSVVRQKSSLCPVSNTHLGGSSMIETVTDIPRFRGTVSKHG